MAKKKLSNQSNEASEDSLSQQQPEEKPTTTMEEKTKTKNSSEKPPPPPPSTEDSSEKITNLKSLNALLVKETVERRGQVDSLLKSKEALESEINRFESENRKLEEEKSLLEGKVKEAETLEKLALASLSEEVSRKRVLEEEMAREKEELLIQVEEKKNEISKVRDEFVMFRERVVKDLDLKEKEEVRLKALVEELEKSNGEDQEELREMTIAYNQVFEQKKDLQSQIADLKTVMGEIVRDRTELEKAKEEQEIEITKLKKTVDDLSSDVERERSSLEGVVREKESIGKNLEIKVKEVEGLNSKLVELEKRNSVMSESAGLREKEMEKLVVEKMERERTIESLTSEKVSVERSLEDSMKMVEDLNRKMRQLQEKTEGEKTMHLMKIAELEKNVEQLRSTMSNLQKEKEGLESKVAGIQESYDGALEKQTKLRKELGLVVEEKVEKERAYELLMADKNSIASSLEKAFDQLKIQAKEMEDIGKAKSEVERVKIALEIKIEELQKEVISFKASESALQASCEEQNQKINQLEYEVVCLKDNLGKVTAERDVVLKELEMKKEEEASLKVKISALEKSVGEQSRKINQLECEVVGFKENLGKVTNERDDVLKKLGLKKEEAASLKVKILALEKSVDEQSRKTNQLECEVVGFKDNIGKVTAERDVVLKELELKKEEEASLKVKVSDLEKNVEDLELQNKSLNNSLMEARKRKNIWTWLSSATTIFAAASVAYAARAR